MAQDVEEDWPLEIVGHDGIPVNVTMRPGDMILYESHSILHGRPYPLQGNYFANIFVHFEPLFYSMNLEQELIQRNSHSIHKKNSRADEATFLREKYEQALSQWDDSSAVSSETKRQDLPLHIQEGTLEATRWRQEFVFVKEEKPQKSHNNNDLNEKSDSQKTHNINRLAARGALDAIRELAQNDPAILQQRDANHWQALHEAARAGQTQVVEFLIEKGVDLNTRTNNGNGGTALWWAEHVRKMKIA